MHRPTDHARLDLNRLNLDVAFGRAGGKVIWQPRIGCYFTDKAFTGEPLPERYRGMSHPQIYRDLGCSNRLYCFNKCFRSVEPPAVVHRTEEIDSRRTRHITETPVGAMVRITRSTPNNWHHVTEKRLVESPAEMKVATWIADRTQWRWDQAAYDELAAAWDGLGAPTMYIPRVNVQDLYINTMGVERAIYAIHEWGAVIDDYFKVLHESHLRLIEIINDSPIELINFGDNIHSATLSPRLYEQYALPAYLDRCERLHRAGKFISSHWDGNVKGLLPYAKTSGLDAIEAITPTPQGDVGLEEIKDALGDEIVLMDGIPAVFFDETFPEGELIACTEKVIELFAPRLVLGISDEISSTGDLERIRIVGRIVDDYNASQPGCSSP